MELSAQYAYKVYEKRSFTLAAAELHVSQPGLSASIARLEEQLGFRIFDRHTLPLSLTPEGQVYIEMLEETIKSEAEMKRKIRALGSMESGHLRIGGHMYAAYSLLPSVCGRFYQKHPKIGVTVDFSSESELLKKLFEGALDLMLGYRYDEHKHEAFPLVKERAVIAMRRDLEGADRVRHLAVSHEEVCKGETKRRLQEDDLSAFEGIPFFSYGRFSDLATRFSHMMKDCRFSPYALANTRQIGIHYDMMAEGLGAIITTDLLLRDKCDRADILYFPLDGAFALRTLYVIRSKGAVASRASEAFCSVLMALCKERYESRA